MRHIWIAALMLGAAIAILGEAIRLWAAGHLEQSKEITSSGPYRYTRHPLYLGSRTVKRPCWIGAWEVMGGPSGS